MSRGLDAEVAEKVMGLPQEDIHRRTMVRSDLPHYSTDIAAAWLVVEKMRERGYYLELRGWVQVNDFMACFILPDGKEHCIIDSSAALAICRAAIAVATGNA